MPSKTPAPSKTAVASKSSAPKGKAPAKKDTAPKLSKWQQHVEEMMHASAPGDEYFGKMKMSYLGINNTFRDNLVRAGSYTTDPKLLSQINWADDALTSWGKKYPNDPQLARSYFLAFEMYRKIWVKTYQDKAWQYAHIVVHKWPSSFFGKQLNKDLQIGFTERYFADPQPCEVPVPAPSGKKAQAAIASPSPTPAPTPTPTTAPGQPKVQVLPAPCVPPPTPEPSLSPSSSPTP